MKKLSVKIDNGIILNNPIEKNCICSFRFRKFLKINANFIISKI